MKRFSEDHVWVEVSGDKATVGITAYAASELGEITFVESPENGIVLTQSDVLCVVESVKTASDVFVPVSGTVCAVNDKLEENPGLINAGAEGDGWICQLAEIDRSELDSLLTEEEYETFISADEDDD